MGFETPDCLLVMLKAALGSAAGNEKQIALVEDMWQNLKLDPAVKTEYDEMLNDSFEKNKVVRKVIKQRQAIKEELKPAEADVRKPLVKKQT